MADQFKHASRDGRVLVYEGATAFWVVRMSDGEERCIGDGVDMFTQTKTHIGDVDNDFEDFLDVGTPEFYAALRKWVDAWDDEMMEAYFGYQD